MERAEKDDLEDFVMIPDMHKPSVKSPRSASESTSDQNNNAPLTSPTRPKSYDSDSNSSNGSGGYVISPDDKYSLASVIEHSADFNGPIEHDFTHSTLEESTIFEESPSENNGTYEAPAVHERNIH